MNQERLRLLVDEPTIGKLLLFIQSRDRQLQEIYEAFPTRDKRTILRWLKKLREAELVDKTRSKESVYSAIRESDTSVTSYLESDTDVTLSPVESDTNVTLSEKVTNLYRVCNSTTSNNINKEYSIENLNNTLNNTSYIHSRPYREMSLSPTDRFVQKIEVSKPEFEQMIRDYEKEMELRLYAREASKQYGPIPQSLLLQDAAPKSTTPLVEQIQQILDSHREPDHSIPATMVTQVSEKRLQGE